MKSSGSLYLQVMKKIKQEIISKKYPVDSKLPSEIELMKKFNVSRVTLRKAIEGLVNDGIVEKVQGVGSFVRKPKKVRRIIRSSAVESFSEIALKEGFKPSTIVIEVKEVEVTGRLKELLESKRALFIKRLRLLDKDPIMLENNYFPLPRFKKLKNNDLTQSLYNLFREQFKIEKLISNNTTINIDLASKNEATLLKKSIGYPLFVLKTVVNDENNEVVQVGKQFIVSDRYEFHI